jgi:DNA-binding MarR family transcriptional regulator
MAAEQEKLDLLLHDVRTCCHHLKRISDALHSELGVTASMRSVMEAIVDGGQQTVPQIARTRGVSRQHIQVNVDALLEKELVRLKDNPAHKRSPLIGLTRSGRALFGKIQRREQAVFKGIDDSLSPRSLTTASNLLQSLNGLLAERLPE